MLDTNDVFDRPQDPQACYHTLHLPLLHALCIAIWGRLAAQGLDMPLKAYDSNMSTSLFEMQIEHVLKLVASL